jgi:hypothetical protein
MKALVVLVAGAVAVALAPARADACSCLVLTEAEQLERADLVFEGAVASVEPGAEAGTARARFRIEKLVKGTADDTTLIDHAISSAACGLGELAVGERWRMYVRTMEGGLLHANLCGGSTRLEGKAGPGPGATGPTPIAGQKRGCGGCGAGGDGAGGAWVLLAFVWAGVRAERARRRRR